MAIMDTSLITEYWDQIIVLFLFVVMAVRLRENVTSLRKDVDSLSANIEKRDTYVEVVKLRAELDAAQKNVSALWDYVNNLRDRMNGK
tara:strand:+ start:674 stop:937 length:264 start_codon:yes stop_codon:yes gene_type:complete